MLSKDEIAAPGTDARTMLEKIEPDRLPGHVAIIMDGNGRWATARTLPRVEGHRAGVAASPMCAAQRVYCRRRYVFHFKRDDIAVGNELSDRCFFASARKHRVIRK